jgi:hypothetical protein
LSQNIQKVRNLKHEKMPFSRGKKVEMRSDIILTFFFIFGLKEWLKSKDIIRKLQYMTGFLFQKIQTEIVILIQKKPELSFHGKI